MDMNVSMKYNSQLTGGAKSSYLLFSVCMEGWPSGQRQQTVNLPTNVYAGSNPAPSTSLRCFAATAGKPLRKMRQRRLSAETSVKAGLKSIFAATAGKPLTILSGCSSMVELQPSKLAMRVRFPSPAPSFAASQLWLAKPRWVLDLT